MPRKKKEMLAEREWLVRLRVTFSGAPAIITATSAEEARRRAENGEWDDGPDCTNAELVDWSFQKIEESR